MGHWFNRRVTVWIDVYQSYKYFTKAMCVCVCVYILFFKDIPTSFVGSAVHKLHISASTHVTGPVLTSRLSVHNGSPRFKAKLMTLASVHMSIWSNMLTELAMCPVSIQPVRSVGSVRF